VGNTKARCGRAGWSSTAFDLAGVRTTVETLSLDETSDVHAAYTDLASRLLAEKRTVLYEKTFGVLGCCEEVTTCRDGVLADKGLEGPACHTYIEGRPCHEGTLAGLQVWTLDRATADGLVVARTDRSGAVSAKVETPSGAVVFVSGVTGSDPRGSTDDAAAFREAFEGAERLLVANGLTFRNVARTWLHLPDLLAGYAALNQARSAFLRERELIVGEGPVFLPASTAVGGRHCSGAGCLLDLVAVAPPGLLAPLASTRQGPAIDYGSAFSRGMLVSGAGRPANHHAPVVFVSGTASIDPRGRSMHLGDPAGQIRETYRITAAVLRNVGCSFDGVASAVRYYSDLATWGAHRDLSARGLLPDLPAIDVLGTICREELLFELEVTAVGRSGGHAPVQ